MPKRLLFAITAIMLLILAFNSTALAEQAKSIDTTATSGNQYNAAYAPTTTTHVYNDTTLTRLKSATRPGFNNEGTTNYPYEIYLPNEGAPANYRIHSNYTNDTDACASCHATHTAVGAGLLQWYSVYDTCIACHDGTVTTTYNVVNGTVGTTGFLTYGGMFGTGNESFLSNHNVVGAVNISAAPGGSSVSVNRTTDMGKVITQWQTTFGCESCHSPHGQGGNARILHPDANGVATQKKAASYTTVEYPASSGEYAVLVNDSPVLFLVGYPYKVTVDGGTFLGNSAGYSKFSAAGLTVEGTPSLKVAMNISAYLTTNESVTHVSGMNAFCGACHTDYNTEDVTRPGVNANGTFSKAMRHAVGVDYSQLFVTDPAPSSKIGSNKYMQTEGNRITCLTCHVAHGVSKNYWTRAMTKYNGAGVFGNWGSEDSKLAELSGSSALKRLPNMATCEACHEKGDAASGYLANTDQADYEQDVDIADAALLASPAGLTTETVNGNVYLTNDNYVGWKECAKCHTEQAKPYKAQEAGLKVYVKWTSDITSANDLTVVYDTREFDSWYNRVKHGQKIMPVTVTTNAATLKAEIEAIPAQYRGTFGDTSGIAWDGITGSEWTGLTNFHPEALSKWFAGNGSAARTAFLNKIGPDKVKFTQGVKWKQRYVFDQKDWNGSDTGLYTANGLTQWNPAMVGTATKGWVSYGGGDIDTKCSGCHTTGVNTLYTNTSYSANPDKFFKDTGITCEACHGPGKNHAKYPTTKNIVNPSKLAMGPRTDVCGQCHNRGVNAYYTENGIKQASYGTISSNSNNGSPRTESPWGFIPGMANFFAHPDNGGGFLNWMPGTRTYQVLDASGNWLPGGIQSNNGAFYNTTTGFSRQHHQQFTDFLQSTMYQTKVVTCTTCHDPHKQNSSGSQLKAEAATLCASCHDRAVDINKYMPKITGSAVAGPANQPTSNSTQDIRTHRFTHQIDLNSDGTYQENETLPRLR